VRIFGGGKSHSKASRGEPGFWNFLGRRRSRSRTDNPSRGLTIQRAIRLMESYHTGDFADLMWTFGAPWTGVENSDPDYLSIIERTASSLKEMSWQIRQWKPKRGADPEPEKEKLAQEQARILEAAYERMKNVHEAIGHLMLAYFRGFSIVEPDIAGGEFIPIDHWNVRRDGLRGAWFFNESGLPGAPLEKCDAFRDDIIVLENPRPIGRIALIKYIRANLSERDWDHFVEIYGLPAGLLIAPQNAGAGSEALEKFRAAAAAAARGGDVAFPHGTQWIGHSSERGIQPFKPRLDWLSEKLVQAGTGGMLTMLSMPGSGTLAGSAHMEAFKTLARGKAADISEAFQRCFDQRILIESGSLQRGAQPLAWFEISAREEQDAGKSAEQVVRLSQFFDLDEQQVEERTGWIVARKLQPATSPYFGALGAPTGYRAQRAGDGSDMAAAAALREDLAPIRELISKALAECGGDLRAAIERLIIELPEIAPALTTGKLEEVFEVDIAQAMAATLEAEAKKRAQERRED
jgi:phage gp29-like protein